MKAMGTDRPDKPAPTTRTSARAGAASTPARQPRQARGRERIEAILDAAADIIASEGLQALTMLSLTQRARTSTGSMYHFFRDRGSVLEALVERHVRNTAQIAAMIDETTDDHWATMPVEAVMERIAMPFLRYFDHHRDYTELLASPQVEIKPGNYRALLQRVLRLRAPGLGDAELRTRTDVIYAVSVGGLRIAVQSPAMLAAWKRECVRVLTAYLETLETPPG